MCLNLVSVISVLDYFFSVKDDLFVRYVCAGGIVYPLNDMDLGEWCGQHVMSELQ